MNRRRVTRGLAWFLSGVFIVLGAVEVGIRLAGSNADGVWFWFLVLCGGGAMIAAGTLIGERRRWTAVTLVAVGGLAALLATVWTLILPILTLALIALTISNAAQPAAHS